MQRRFSQSSCDDPTLLHAESTGYTPETLPALRQYLNARESGNLEAAERISENLRAFFEERGGTT